MMAKFNYWQKLKARRIYHVYNRSVGETDLFRVDENYQFFLEKWKQYLGHYLDVYAYCLMPNHFHFMVCVKPLDEELSEHIKKENTVSAKKLLQKEIEWNTFLEDQFKRLFSSYSLSFNKQHNRKGTLFQKRFKRVGLFSESTIVNKFLYIHHNPIHHQFTAHYDDWKYSSYSAYFSNHPTQLNKAAMFSFLNIKNEKNAYEKLNELHQKYKEDKWNNFLDMGEEWT